jgi:hypothetical protein
MNRFIRYALVPVGAVAMTVGMATPASAFHCTNPNRNDNAPTAGVNYMLTGFEGEEPILEKVGPGNGIGGWVAVAPGVIGNGDLVYTSPHNVLGGPGTDTEEHACDGQGIDYIHC